MPKMLKNVISGTVGASVPGQKPFFFSSNAYHFWLTA